MHYCGKVQRGCALPHMAKFVTRAGLPLKRNFFVVDVLVSFCNFLLMMCVYVTALTVSALDEIKYAVITSIPEITVLIARWRIHLNKKHALWTRFYSNHDY